MSWLQGNVRKRNRWPGLPISADSSAQSFLLATGITDITQKKALSSLVYDLKRFGLWSKFIAIWPFVGASASTHKFNLINPVDSNAGYRLSFFNSPTHNSSGVAWNGTTQYADTFVNPSLLSSIISSSNAAMHYYTTTQSASTGTDMGVFTSTTFLFGIQASSGNMDVRFCTPTSGANIANPYSTGLFTGSKLISGAHKGYRNGQLLGSNATSTSSIPDGNIFLGARNNNSTGTPTASAFSPRQCCFAAVSTGFTDIEAQLLFLAVQNYQSILGRAV